MRTGYVWVGVSRAARRRGSVEGVERGAIRHARRHRAGRHHQRRPVVRHLRASDPGGPRARRRQHRRRPARAARVRDRPFTVRGTSRHLRQFGAPARADLRRGGRARRRRPYPSRSRQPEGLEAVVRDGRPRKSGRGPAARLGEFPRVGSRRRFARRSAVRRQLAQVDAARRQSRRAGIESGRRARWRSRRGRRHDAGRRLLHQAAARPRTWGRRAPAIGRRTATCRSIR